MTVFRRLSAAVRIKKCVCGVTMLTYSGPMHNRDFNELRDQAIGHSKDAQALLLDMRGVVPMSDMAPLIDELIYAGSGAAPGAIIAPETHTATWWRHAVRLAAYGVARAVFTSEREARTWARARLPGRQRA